MTYTINGNINALNNSYFQCIAVSDFTVKVYEVRFGSSDIYIDSITLNPDGSFEKDISTAATTIVVKLLASDGSVVDTSQKFCAHDCIQVTFDLDENLAGNPVYDKIMSRFSAASNGLDVNNPVSVAGISDDDIRKLACIICVQDDVVFRIRQANKLWNDLVSFQSTMPSTYTSAKGAINTLLWGTSEAPGGSVPPPADHIAAGRKLMFVLLKTSTSASLGEVFNHSEAQFGDIISTAEAGNIVGAGLGDSTNLDLYAGARNGLLFNANNDGLNQDAKVIHLSTAAYANKSAILDSSLDQGGLSGTIALNPADLSHDLTEISSINTLNDYTQSYAPFLAAAVAASSIGRTPDYHSITTTGPTVWKNALTSYGGALPFGYTSTDQYAGAINTAVSADYPTARVAYQAKNDSNLSSIMGSTSDATSLFSKLKANPTFNFDNESAHLHFVTTGSGTNTLTATAMQNLQTLQRVVKLSGDSGSLANTGILLSRNFTSATKIVNTGQVGFLSLSTANLDGLLGLTLQAATQVWCYAKSVYDGVTAMAALYKRYEAPGALLPAYVNESKISLPGTPPPANQFPDMDAIFHDTSSCSCKECESIYGAAAYLTDMLQWLEKDIVAISPDTRSSGLSSLENNNAGGSKPSIRRRDIRYIKLNCENTNTLVPYIDIVNEILSINLNTSPATYYPQLQTLNTADEIRIEPENRFPTEEDKLLNYSYPWNLPYSVPFDQAVSYLRSSEKEYQEIIADFSTPSLKYSTDAWAQAFLNINPTEWNVYLNNTITGTFWIDYWGITGSPSSLNVVQMEEAAGVTYDELLELLNAFYIRSLAPAVSKIFITPAGDLCDVEGYNVTPAFTSLVANLFMKFIRLKRKTGLSTWELDIAITNITASGMTINASFMQQFAAALEFSKKYNIAFSEVLMLLGNNSYWALWTPTVFSSYYMDKFQNELLHSDIRAYFSLTVYNAASGKFSSDVTALQTKEKQYLSVVLGIDIPTVDAIILYMKQNAIIGTSSVPFTTTVLGLIHRYAAFANAFQLSASDFPLAISLFGNIFASSPIIKAALDFGEALAQFRTLDISLSDFKNIIEASGPYANSAGNAFDIEANKSWTATEKVLQDARKANLDKDITNATYTTFYTDLLVKELAAQFNLQDADVQKIITAHSSTWLSTFIADADGTTTARVWAQKRAAYVPVYQIFKRILLLTELFGMEMVTVGENEKQGLIYGLETQFSPITKNVPGTPFFWLTNSFTSALTSTSIKSLVWLKRANRQAEMLDMPQRYQDPLNPVDFYLLVDDFFTNNLTYSTSPYPKISNIYNKLGSASVYTKLSVHEFIEIFLRAQAITPATTDLVAVLDNFEAIYNVTRTFNIKVVDAWAWVWTTAWSTGTFTASTVNRTLSADIKRTLHNKYPQQTAWSNVIVPVEDDLRESLRDALVAVYVGHKNFVDQADLYQFYLLDTQMSSCTDTSRIVAATSSVQLLLHRAMLGLESQIPFYLEDKKEWEWRKNYRVWQAARKVFLYPENWIDPSLRLNKTPQFKEAEDFLQQDEINDENTERAFGNYLSSLSEIARLNVVATYVQNDVELRAETKTDYDRDIANTSAESYKGYTPAKDPKDETLHVFARTWNPPYIYYYRNLHEGVWTAWEKMDVEINSDHLIPVIFNRKLYLFFPMIVDKMFNKTENNVDYRLPCFDVQMCYTKKDFGKWTSKKVLNGKLMVGNFSRTDGVITEEKEMESRVVSDGSVSGLDSWLKTLPNYSFGIGSQTWSGPRMSYAFVSMKKQDFYFWAELQTNGDLEIKCRRLVDPAIYPGKDSSGKSIPYFPPLSHIYSFENTFSINAATESVQIVRGEPTDLFASLGGKSNWMGFIARPENTIPFSQQLKTDGTSTKLKLRQKNFDGGFYDWDTTMFYANAKDFVLTYPHQYKHNVWPQPFFYSDDKRSLFFKSEQGWAYSVYSNEHPYIHEMMTALNVNGIDGLLNPPAGPDDMKRQMKNSNYFQSTYSPDYGNSIAAPANVTPPKMEFDFGAKGPYAIYNWEVFFHIGSLMARKLRESNKFAESMKWLNYIFDPTEISDPNDANNDIRYWQVKPFFQDVSSGSIRKMMRLLSMNYSTLTTDEQKMVDDYKNQIQAWREHPFEPHVIAALRPRAYMLWVMMEYVTLLTDWGDYLFRQDTTEAINEATNLYMIASQMMGSRPVEITRPEITARSYDDLTAAGSLDAMSNALVTVENFLPSLSFCSCPSNSSYIRTSQDVLCTTQPMTIRATDLMFCIPANPKIVEMWDRIDDRLFKIRHCMNIDGQIRSLALFSPPIDPALLVQAAAAGISIADAISTAAGQLPIYRFTYLMAKANELCNEVKGLGSQLLTLLEKQDAEELAMFRQVHEQNILKAGRNIKEMSLSDANQNKTTLEASKNLVQIRLDDYKNREYKNNREDNAMRQTQLSEGFMYAEQGARLLGGILNLIPDFYAGFTIAKVAGGSKINRLIDAGASSLNIVSTVNRNKASMSLTFASYDRRLEEWNLQIKSATEELAQIDRQLIGSDIRIAMSQKELDNHDLQVEQSDEMYQWLKDKYTNKKLYSWMVGQVKIVYRQMFDLAFQMAQKAQICYDNELGTSGTNIIQYGQWDSSRSGLLAGERLSLQLKQLESNYIGANVREYELSKNISLALLDPNALETLKATGACDIYLPELLFDLDHPGHYFRRIKSVSISIPCIAGPNTNVSATLMLNTHGRRSTTDTSTYVFADTPDSGHSESIATSSSQNDSGMFEMNFKDERYLPFEGKGAVSTWTLKLSQLAPTSSGTHNVVRLLDFSTISDVVMHMKYTAKEGGKQFATFVTNYAAAQINTTGIFNTGGNGMRYAFSLRHDMPDLWNNLKQSNTCTFTVEKTRLPYMMQAFLAKVTSFTFFVSEKSSLTTSSLTLNGSGITSGPVIILLASVNTTPQGILVDTGVTPSMTATAIGAGYTLAMSSAGDVSKLDDIVIVAQLNMTW